MPQPINPYSPFAVHRFMSLYEAKYRTTLVVRHRKSGGYWTGLPKDLIDQLRVGDGYHMEVAIIRTMAPPVDSHEKEEGEE